MVTFDSISGVILNVAMILLGFIFLVAAIIGLYFYSKHLKRYKQFTCVIWGKDGFGQKTEQYDSAGIFIDTKTGNKRLFLKKLKVGLNPDNIPYIQNGNKKIIYFYRTGLKNLHYIKINVDEPAVTLTVGEEDVNWATNAYERQKKLFSQSLLMQLMPFIALAFVAIIILILFIYLFKDMGVIKEAALAFKDAVTIQAAASSGTTIIPS